MRLATFAAGAALAATGAAAQESQFPGTINCKVDNIANGNQQYTVHIGEPDSTCAAVADSLSALKDIYSYTCAGYVTHDATQVSILAAGSQNEAVVEAFKRAYPGLGFYQKGACRKAATMRDDASVDAGRATRGVTKRAPAGQAIYNICDITSVAGQNNGRTALLVNVDIGLPFNSGSGCNHIRARIRSVGDWTCTDNGSGGTSLKFTTQRDGKLIAVRDATVSDVLNAYGGAITSQDVGGVHGHGFCTATYPGNKRRATRSAGLSKRVNSNQLVFNACDITSAADQDAGKIDLLISADIGIGAGEMDFDDYCESIHVIISDLTSWACQDNGSGGTLLEFTTKRDGLLVPVRDSVVADIESAYLTLNRDTEVIGGVHDHGFCTIGYDGINRQ